MVPLKFYQKALEYQDERFKRTFEAETEYLVRHIVDLAQEKRGLVKVLDVGCGNGRTMENIDKELSKHHPQVMFYLTGIDSDPEKLKVAKEIPQARFVQGNIITDTHLLEDGFDLVYSSYNTIGCIQEGTLKEFLEKMYHVARVGAKIINITWKRDTYTTEFLKDYYKAMGFRPVYVFDDLSICIDPENNNLFRFNRVSSDEVGKAFWNIGINELAVKEVNCLWQSFEVKR